MPQEPPQRPIDGRLDAVEEQLDRIESQLGQTNKGGGGIGCLGLVLFYFVLAGVYESRDLLREVLRAVTD